MTTFTTTTHAAEPGNGNPGIVPPWLDPEKPLVPRPRPAGVGLAALAMEARSLEARSRSLAQRFRDRCTDPELGPTIGCSLDEAAVRFDRAATLMAEQAHTL